jgi:putative restriction endonuclease
MRGIAPHGSSIVLSGGYADDEDMGEFIIYTGASGRDPNAGRQVADQQLVLGNRALAESHLNGIPICVRRGKAHVSDMPEGFRYRYDGLYRVARYWQEPGRDGFKIWRFRIQKFLASGDATSPEDTLQSESGNIQAPDGNQIPNRRRSTITRLVRSTMMRSFPRSRLPASVVSTGEPIA